jgi:hypothetical protein
VVGVIYSNQASIASGFKIEQSIDRSTILDTQTYTIAASTGTRVEAQVVASWFRVSFEHGGVAPTTFQLEAYGSIAVVASSLLGSSVTVAGAAAEDAAVVGDPVLTGGRYDSSDRSLDDGDVGALAVTAAGEVKISSGIGATGLGKAVDGVGGATDTGIAVLALRDDALTALTPVDGDYVRLRVDANGALWTRDDILEAVVSGSELQVDVVTLPGVSAENETPGSGMLIQGDDGGAMGGNVRNIAINTAGHLQVDTTDVVPGTGATNLGKAEDAAHTSGDVGVMALAVRNTILASLSGADGDYSALQVDDNGALYQVPGDHIDMVSVAGTQATAASTSVISAPGVGKAVKILGGNFQQNAASPTNPQRIAIENGTGGAEKFVARLSANDGAGIGFSHPVIMSANNAVHLDSDQADSFIWSLTYTIVDM